MDTVTKKTNSVVSDSLCFLIFLMPTFKHLNNYLLNSLSLSIFYETSNALISRNYL